ncbi:hypothetical protein SmJEL517_g04081 [Synchytrium microbalum]|uniref:Uncharacterized protein n=1 Tax=Synchytrium microbalum TaxID=1806994 RepID=A0A507C0H7_9FUNG|nr:uncharacterized protein SmJEL517_g04081 [Synchytrium microbalum]TPX32911.1 hypothetical protein SmJEL517_g04081 [Synchytrium microbalum]
MYSPPRNHLVELVESAQQGVAAEDKIVLAGSTEACILPSTLASAVASIIDEIPGLISRNENSVSFYIQLEPAKRMRPMVFRRHSIGDTLAGPLLHEKIELRLRCAESRRVSLIDDRKTHLQRTFERIRYQVLIQRQREKIVSLRRQTRAQYAQSSAQLKRHLILRKNVERCSAVVEHAHMVSSMQKLKKFMSLRKSLTDSIADMLNAPHRMLIDLADLSDEEEDDQARAMPMIVENDEEYSDIESPFPAFSTARPIEEHHVNLASLRSSHHHGEHSNEAVVAGVESSKGGLVIGQECDDEETDNTILVPEYVDPPSFDSSSESIDKLPSLVVDDASSLSSESTLQPFSYSSSLDDMRDEVAIESKLRHHNNSHRRAGLVSHIPLDDSEEEYLAEFGPLMPPINRFTLRELDLEEILTNAQLRHDLYFDPNLQFKPNTEGERGQAKQARAKEYWTDVERELTLGSWKRIPLLLLEIRAIVVELLPYSPGLKEQLERAVDITLIAQEIQHGVFDGLNLIEYLADLLRVNCAPARDRLVDSMVVACKDGDFASTLRIVFEVLELMKLDYANHQLHRLRPYVVENAVAFEWRWFKEQIEAGTRKLDETSTFIQDAVNRAAVNTSVAAGKQDQKGTVTSDREVASSTENLFSLVNQQQQQSPNMQQIFHQALINLISNACRLTEIGIPETLILDASRLVTFYNDWQDIIIMGALLILFRQAAGSKCSASDLASIKQQLWVLLNDAETSMSHVSLQMISAAGKIRSAPLSETESSLLSGMVDKTLSPKSPLYEMLQKRLGGHLEQYLSSGRLDSDAISRHGLRELEDEVVDLAERIRKLADFNRSVYGTVYNALMQQAL